MRELASELERKKIEEERRKKRSRRERENRKCIFNWRGERIVIKKFFFFFLPVNYSAHLKIDVYCS